MARFFDRSILHFAFRLGAFADGLWAIVLLCPSLYAFMTGKPDIDFDADQVLVMHIAAALMASWALLLLWADRKPQENRIILLITLFPLSGIMAAVTRGIIVEPDRALAGAVVLTQLFGLWLFYAYVFWASGRTEQK